MAVMVDVIPEVTRNPLDKVQAEWTAGIKPKKTSAPPTSFRGGFSNRQKS